MLFRIEDVSGFEPNLRTYDIKEVEKPIIKKMEIDQYIASKIRAEINGHKKRGILSYSKSLAVCLLKYNKFGDNELHIYPTPPRPYPKLNFIWFKDEYSDGEYARYSIKERLNKRPLPDFFGAFGEMQLLNFVIDVSDNKVLDEYLKIYTNVGKCKFASPEKDKEVVVMCPPIDLVVKSYIDSIYILYALQMKYRFLDYKKEKLIYKINQLPEERFYYFPDTKEAIIQIIEYMERYWRHEYEISLAIYKDLFWEEIEEKKNKKKREGEEEKKEDAKEKRNKRKNEHFFYYDSNLQFINILKYTFEDSYSLSDYNSNVVSDLIWEVCSEFWEEQEDIEKKSPFKRFLP